MATTSTIEDAAPVNTAARARARRQRVLAWVLPIVTLAAAVAVWEFWVWYKAIPHYLIPAPSRIWATLMVDGPSLMRSAWFTIRLTFFSLALAIVGGVLLGALFALSRPVEMSLFPFALILQVTPIVAIAPLILIYVHDTFAALLICAWLVAFFPILSNTVVGLRSTDHNLRDLFTLYRASPWQRLRLLLAPSALPYFMAALKIAGGARADRGGGGRVRGGGDGIEHRARLAHHRIELPQRDPADVRGAGAGLAARRRDLPDDGAGLETGARPLARKRDQP